MTTQTSSVDSQAMISQSLATVHVTAFSANISNPKMANCTTTADNHDPDEESDDSTMKFAEQPLLKNSDK